MEIHIIKINDRETILFFKSEISILGFPLRPAHFHNGNSYTGDTLTLSWYWNDPNENFTLDKASTTSLDNKEQCHQYLEW